MSDDTLSGQLTQRTTWARESRDCYLSMTPQELARLAGMARRLEADLAAARAEVEALRARKPSLPDKLERRLCEVAEGDDESPEGYRIAVQVARDLLAALDAPAPGEPEGEDCGEELDLARRLFVDCPADALRIFPMEEDWCEYGDGGPCKVTRGEAGHMDCWRAALCPPIAPSEPAPGSEGGEPMVPRHAVEIASEYLAQDGEVVCERVDCAIQNCPRNTDQLGRCWFALVMQDCGAGIDGCWCDDAPEEVEGEVYCGCPEPSWDPGRGEYRWSEDGYGYHAKPGAMHDCGKPLPPAPSEPAPGSAEWAASAPIDEVRAWLDARGFRLVSCSVHGWRAQLRQGDHVVARGCHGTEDAAIRALRARARQRGGAR